MTSESIREEEHQSRFDPRLWQRILAHARPFRLPLAGLAASGLLVAAGDVLLPRVTGLLVDAAIAGEGHGRLLSLVARYAAISLGMSLLVWGFIVLAGRVATGTAYEIRRKAFDHLQELSFSFYDRRPVGWLISRVTSDCERIADLLPWFCLDLFWGTSLILGIAGMMLYLQPVLALCVLALTPPLALVSVYFQKRLLSTQRKVRRINSLMTASFTEAIMGVRTTKAFVREEESLREFRRLSADMFENSSRNLILSAVYLPLVITVGSVGTGLALWQGGVRIGEVSAGTLVAFMQYAAFFYVPIQELAARFTGLQSAQAAVERVQGLLDTEPEIRDAADAVAPGPDEPVRLIEFRDVSFAYQEGKEVLGGFNLRVVRGESIALVGATGSGKTTIVNLLARFYEATSGAVLVNGIDVRRIRMAWLHGKIALVLQSPHLFSGTVRENIRYGRLDASDAEVEEAARLVNADGFIAGLERGYETEVGERGDRLSTGQKQLVALARAILARPEILILDEATSSIDTETERLVQEGVERLLAGRTSFVIAHRISTVQSADRILVIDRGRLVEEGSHEELLRVDGRYARLYRGQFVRQEEERALERAAGGEDRLEAAGA